jgi:Putative redox-active protein (C_GCAxxG_C_C)
MNSHDHSNSPISRRDVLTASAALMTGAGMGAALTGCAPSGPSAAVPPLPWKWVKLDPLEAGRRAYRIYLDRERGGCGNASYLSLLSLLQEKVGHPWTTMPDMLMAHAAAGFGGHGTLCGALAGASTIINMVTYGEVRDTWQQNSQIVDRLFYWYADQDFPPERFDDLSKLPRQVKARAKSPLCHTSLSAWAMAAEENIRSDAKKERCAKVAGEVVYTVTHYLNEFFEGKWTPAVWTPSPETEHCVRCHGPDTATHRADMWDQQGHMECLMCHTDHTV